MDAFNHHTAFVQVRGRNTDVGRGLRAHRCWPIVLVAAACWLPTTIALADGTQRDVAQRDVAQRDPQLQRATYQSLAERTPATAPAQRLNEPMPFGSTGPDSSVQGGSRATHRETPATPSAGPAILSMFGSLAVVIGLFLGLVWLLRRGSPKLIRLLSSDVVELLGRSPLAGRQQMHVIRFGNRLLLVAVSPDGAETLAEINDPPEVDRIAGLCQQTQPTSATQAFRQVFGQLAELRRPKQIENSAPVERPSRGAAKSDSQAVAQLGSRISQGSSGRSDDDV